MPFDGAWPDSVSAEQSVALREALAAVRAHALRPPPPLTLDAWADRFRFLTGESSSEPGRWSTARVEVARGPMRAVTAPGVRELTVVGGTQTLKTELVLNVCGYFISLDPAPMMVIQPSEGMAQEFSKQRLAPMIRSTPALREVFAKKGADAAEEGVEKSNAKSRDTSNTLLSKAFPGGHLAIASASSPSQLASRPIRIVLSDEVDRYDASAGAEGDPVGLAEKRTGNFPSNSLKIRVSSPTDKPSPGKPGSRIAASYDASDQRRPFVPCPHCQHFQVLRMGDKDSAAGIKWPSGRPDEAAYYCAGCGSAWSERDRLEALALVEWRQCKPFSCCGADQNSEDTGRWTWDADQHAGLATCLHCAAKPVPVRHAGFWVSRLYSPFQSVAGVACEFMEVRKSPQRLKTFLNTVLAELWEEPSESVAHADLLARREVYPAEVPDGVVALFAGVDTQDNRLECTVLGVGRDEEFYLVDHSVFFGDTGEPEVWTALDEHLQKLWTRRDGVAFVVQAAAVDSGGHRTQHVYEFCRTRVGRRVWAVRGRADTGGRRSPVWPGKPTLKNKGRVPLYEVGTASAKFFMRSCLAVSVPGPRYVHFPESCGPQYFDQLSAERLVTRFKNGATWLEWTCPDGRRNESWDCLIYAYAAYAGMLQAGFKSTPIPMRAPTPQHVVLIEKEAEAPTPSPTPVATATLPVRTPAPASPPPPQRRGAAWLAPQRRGGWLK